MWRDQDVRPSFPADAGAAGPEMAAGHATPKQDSHMIRARTREAFEVVSGRADAGVLVLCDHASNAIPPEYADLGLPPADLVRHIAWDPGAAGVARHLAALLGVPAVLSRFSRLLVDPNRGLDDPTLVMRIADGSVIPGNAHIDAAERARRIDRFWRPYDDPIAETIDAMCRTGRPPVLVSIHTYTPVWRGVPRRWHAGILFDPRAPGISPHIISALRTHLPHLEIGENEPYSGGLPGDTLDRHGIAKGLAHTLVEIRHDLLADDDAQRTWAQHLHAALKEVLDAVSLASSNPAPHGRRLEA